jgi:Uma2 family endonuclease
MATVLWPPDQRVVLGNVSWEVYEGLLADHQDSSAPRFNYDRGTLEIMSPLPEDEEENRALASLVENVGVEWQMSFRNFGSTTFKREDLARGFDPDSCFYLQNTERMRGKTRIDLTVDPPPDLVIEIDPPTSWAPAHSSLDKLPIYAALGVPEVWRYSGKRLSILVLAGGDYQERDESLALPQVTAAALSDLLLESQEMDPPDWILRVRDWARSLRSPAS